MFLLPLIFFLYLSTCIFFISLVSRSYYIFFLLYCICIPAALLLNRYPTQSYFECDENSYVSRLFLFASNLNFPYILSLSLYWHSWYKDGIPNNNQNDHTIDWWCVFVCVYLNWSMNWVVYIELFDSFFFWTDIYWNVCMRPIVCTFYQF